MPELQVVVFSLRDEVCGADTSQVKQIIRYQDVTKIPKMPDFVEGIINLRGDAVPVISLSRRFELGEDEITRKTKILITEIDKHKVGFIVDDVTELTKFAEEEIETIPDIIRKSGNSYIKSVGKKGESIISILDLKCVLTENEVDSL